MNKEDILKILEGATNKNGDVPIRLVRQAFEKLSEPCTDTISRQAAIDAIAILLAYHGSEGAWINQNEALDVLKSLPSAQPDNQVNLCDSCRHAYPDCPSGKDNVIFGNGIGNDNICACNKYESSAQLKPSIVHCEDCRFRHKSPDWKHLQSFGESIWYCEKGRGLNLAEAVELNDYCSSAKRRTNE